MTTIKYLRGLYAQGYLRIDGGLHYVTYNAQHATKFENRADAESYLNTFGITDHSGLWFGDPDDDSCNGLILSVKEVRARIIELERRLAKLTGSTRLHREQRAIAEMERSFLQNNYNEHCK